MPIYFITSNRDKFKEAKAIMPDLEQMNIDLPEIQELDAETVIRHKLLAALQKEKGEFIVEDTSLYFNCLGGLPGPFIKWFEVALGNEGLYEITQRFENQIAIAKTVIGYARDANNMHFFTGEVKGRIVEPKKPSDFGWDPIFQPSDYSISFAEMSPEQKNEMSMRRMAFEQLKEFLGNR